MLPTFKEHYSKGAAQLIPVFPARAECGPAFLIKHIGQFQNLVSKKGQKIKKEKHHGQILFTVAEVMFKEHHGKSTHEAIVQCVFDFALLKVFNLKQAFGYRFSQAGKAQVLFDMHRMSPLYNGCNNLKTTIYRG